MSYKIFISHGSTDRWVAEQINHHIKAAGAESFIDVYDIEKGDDFENRIFNKMRQCRELIVLLTPWSVDRNWVWVEIGAARALKLRIVAVLYQVSLEILETEKGGSTFLRSKNAVELNEIDTYLTQLRRRLKRGKKK